MPDLAGSPSPHLGAAADFCSGNAPNITIALTQSHRYWVTWNFPAIPKAALDLYSLKAQDPQQSKRTITTNTGEIKKSFPHQSV